MVFSICQLDICWVAELPVAAYVRFVLVPPPKESASPREYTEMWSGSVSRQACKRFIWLVLSLPLASSQVCVPCSSRAFPASGVYPPRHVATQPVNNRAHPHRQPGS